jgi:hypothetical protein
MELNNLANLIEINNAYKSDEICFEAERFEHIKGYMHPAEERMQQINEEICNELKISDISTKFIRYFWEGECDKLPWDAGHKLPFDPKLPNIIIPSTGDVIKVIGEHRKILLTFPATYEGKQPFYWITCSNSQQSENIRVLDPSIGKPFHGLEQAFTQEGFYSLPKLKDMKGAGTICVDPKQIIVPHSSLEYF